MLRQEHATERERRLGRLSIRLSAHRHRGADLSLDVPRGSPSYRPAALLSSATRLARSTNIRPMSAHAWIALATLFGAALLFLARLLPPEVVSLSIPVALYLTGVLRDPHDLLGGFGNEQ